MSPAVSIILPTFNRLAFLPAAIASAFAQTFTDWELIIADDGSSGDTSTYLKTLEDPPRVKVIWQSHSGKPAVVRNAALREAQGEFVAFLDSDDIWLPKKLETQIESLRRHAQRKWSYTRFDLVDEAGHPTASAAERIWPAPSGWILETLLTGGTVIALPSVVVARQALEELGAFDEELVMCEDDELWMRLAAHSEIDGIDAPLTRVRRHGEHAGNDIIAWQDRRRIFEKALHASYGARVDSILRRLRADTSVGLARSHAVSGNRLRALTTLASSVQYDWRYPTWWSGALKAALRAFAPPALRRVVRRYRNPRQVHGQSQA
jgi:glycosyltransferase involved in cell wall biosynthesis